MNPEDMDTLVHGTATFARPALDKLVEENAALRRDLARAYGLTALSLSPEAPLALRSLLAKRIKDDAGLVAEENAILVDEPLIHDLLKLVLAEATRKLAHQPVPRMMVETRGEAETLLEMQRKQHEEKLAEVREFLQLIVIGYDDRSGRYGMHLSLVVENIKQFLEDKL